MREDPRLAQLSALCDTAEREAQEWLAAHPEDEGVLRPYVDVAEVRAVLGAAPVGVTPAQGVDGGRVHGLMCNVYAGVTSPSAAVDAVLALVRPVEGVVITPEDIALVGDLIEQAWPDWSKPGMRGTSELSTLAAHLGASS